MSWIRISTLTAALSAQYKAKKQKKRHYNIKYLRINATDKLRKGRLTTFDISFWINITICDSHTDFQHIKPPWCWRQGIVRMTLRLKNTQVTIQGAPLDLLAYFDSACLTQSVCAWVRLWWNSMHRAKWVASPDVMTQRQKGTVCSLFSPRCVCICVFFFLSNKAATFKDTETNIQVEGVIG